MVASIYPTLPPPIITSSHFGAGVPCGPGELLSAITAYSAVYVACGATTSYAYEEETAKEAVDGIPNG